MNKFVDPMYLVDDEEIRFPGGRDSSVVRLRVWRKKGRTPVVVVSQIPDKMDPSRVVTKLADIAFGSYLGYPSSGMHFYEWTEDALSEVLFRPVGNTLRMKHCDPRRTRAGLAAVEFTIGCKLER
jgi:hypothetical protein